MYKWCRLEELDAIVWANDTNNFRFNSLSDSVSVDQHWDLTKFITTCTSQVKIYLGFGGCKLNTPGIREETEGVLLTGMPSICLWYAE